MTSAAGDPTTAFTGIPTAALDFYEDLEADNSKAFWQAHKQTYDEQVRRPVDLLAAALGPEFGTAKIFRPYRDVRFSKDKTPYKNHQGLVVDAPGSGALYLHVGAEGLFVAGGMWQMASDQVQRYRRAVDDDISATALERVLAATAKTGLVLGGDALTRVPTGYAKDHARADLLRRKALTAARSYGCPDWLCTPRAADEVAAAWRAMQPLNVWLSQHVGATEQTRR